MEFTQRFLNHVNETVDKWVGSLVGKVMKRFEILDNEEDRKKAIKEILYESARELKVSLRSFAYGVKFKQRTPTKKDQ